MDIKKVEWYQTVRIKLISIIMLTATLVFTILGALSYQYIKTSKYAELAELTEVSANRLSMHLSIPMWTLDVDQVKELLEAEMEEHRLAAIVVRDEDQRTLFLAKERNQENIVVDSVGSITGDLFNADKIITKDKAQIGVVSIYVTKKFTQAELREFGLGIILAVLILNLVIYIIMVLAINKIILHPLEELTNIAVSISRGDINQEINIESNDEIGNLATAFQKMQISLKIIMQRIIKMNREQHSQAEK